MIILEKTLAFGSVLLLALCISAPLKRTKPVRDHPWLGYFFRSHTFFGILILITGLAHGILAGSAPAMLTGKAAWMLLLLLALSALPKKKRNQAGRRKIHITLGAASCMLVAAHVIQAAVI